jgi:hypothetical protein
LKLWRQQQGSQDMKEDQKVEITLEPAITDPKPPNPEPSPAEVESPTVPPARARAYGVAETVIMPGKQEGKPITQGLQPAKARENYPFKDPAKRGKGRPLGSVNRYTGALKELFLQAVDEVGDCQKLGPNGETDGKGGALAYLKVCAVTERKTFLTVMARLLPITIKQAPPIKKVLTREEFTSCASAALIHA